MKSLQLDNKTAREIYHNGPPAIRKLLEENWGKDFFSQSLIERIKSWADVCDEIGKDPLKHLPFPSPLDEDQEAANAHWRITQTIKLFKQGKKCNYAPGSSQSKYFAWMGFGKKPSGLGFSSTCTSYDFTGTHVGPRLCSLSSEDAAHIATVVCKEDYEKYFNE